MAEKKTSEVVNPIPAAVTPEVAELQRRLLEMQLANEQARSADVSMDARLKAIQLAQAEKLLAEEKKREEEQMLVRKNNAIKAEKKRQERVRVQSSCRHVKQNGDTYLAGQRDHQGNVMLICQRCQKLFVNDEIPPGLRPKNERVGGPVDIAPEPWTYGRRGGSGAGVMDMPVTVPAGMDPNQLNYIAVPDDLS